MSKIQFKTEELSKIVSQLGKLSPSKLLEITRYWHILGDGEVVTFTAYDGANFIRAVIESDAEIDVMVKAEQFGKLIDRTTSATVTLVQEDSSLKVIGNGEYSVDIVAEDEEYPSFDEILGDEVTEDSALLLDSALFSTIANINDSAVSKSGADGIYTAFLIDGDKAVTTDIIRVCINPIKDHGLKMLVPYNLMQVLASIPDEKVYLWQIDDTTIYVSSASVEVYGKLMEGIEDYEDVTQLDSLEMVDNVSLTTGPVLSVLDRLVLFTNVFDKGTVELLFLKDKLRVKTSTNSHEDLPYVEAGKKKSHKEFTCRLNSLLLKEIISTVTSDNFSISYGSENAIKIEANGVVYFLALQDEAE
nr:MAG TPA: beta clamp protein [Caudoviricetes sp.]